MLIRLAAEADDGAIGDLLVQAFNTQHAAKMPGVVSTPERLADLRNQADKRRDWTVLVAEADGAVVGTVALTRPGAPRSEAWIEGAAGLRLLAVAPSHHGQGLSSALMDEAERIARDWHVPALCLHTRRGAAGLHRLYQARGYIREPAGDIDRLPAIFLEAYYLPFPPAAR